MMPTTMMMMMVVLMVVVTPLLKGFIRKQFDIALVNVRLITAKGGFQVLLRVKGHLRRARCRAQLPVEDGYGGEELFKVFFKKYLN